jgi:hypothetical protein
MNLHSLWDTGLVELEEGTPAEVAGRIEKAVTDEDRNQWQGSNTGTVGAGVAGDREGAGVSASLIWGDHSRLH